MRFSKLFGLMLLFAHSGVLMLAVKLFLCSSHSGYGQADSGIIADGYLMLRNCRAYAEIVRIFVSISDVAWVSFDFCILYNASFPIF